MDKGRKFQCASLYLLVLIHLCQSEFVPVFMWGTKSTSDPVPALHKLSQNSFKDYISDVLKSNPTVVLFVEQSLSPEDFGQRDRLGNSPFNYLSKARKSSKVTYLPYVQNPIKAIRHSSEDVFETSIEQLTDDVEIPDSKVIIVALNDARDNEQRFDLLKRHDSFIASVYEKLLKDDSNVLAFYTAHRASWIGSGEIHSRKSRALFAASDEQSPNQYFSESIFFYTSGNANVTLNNNVETVALSYTETNTTDSVVLTGAANTSNIQFSLDFLKSSTGYWYIQSVNLTVNNTLTQFNINGSIYAPFRFSYACGDQTFGNATAGITLPQFQVQPVFLSTIFTKQGKFDDPYNCVGFTTIPIWSGLFVTFILMIIMSIGLTMMMDIKTMDRFDDAKGKTITINVSE